MECIQGPATIRRLMLRQPFQPLLNRLLGLEVAAAFTKQQGPVFKADAAEKTARRNSRHDQRRCGNDESHPSEHSFMDIRWGLRFNAVVPVLGAKRQSRLPAARLLCWSKGQVKPSVGHLDQR